MNDKYYFMKELCPAKIMGVRKGAVVVYCYVSRSNADAVFDNCTMRGIKTKCISLHDYMFANKYLRKQSNKIIEYFLQNGVDKTKALLYNKDS